jgi:hypothetical protein
MLVLDKFCDFVNHILNKFLHIIGGFTSDALEASKKAPIKIIE